MEWKKAAIMTGVVLGVVFGMKYIFPALLPFFFGWILAESVYPAARALAKRKTSKKLRLTERGIGEGLILLFTLAGIGAFLAGGEYLTGKINGCVEMFPQIQLQAENLIEQCCESAEHFVGIPAEESKEYLYRQFHVWKASFLEGSRGMDAAAESVKWCAMAAGAVIVVIVSAILFLQEREQIWEALKKRSFYQKLWHLKKRLAGGAKEYLKAQLKIMGLVCGVCIGGLWILKIPHFIGAGLGIGILDALPILGTGTFLIPGGIIFLIQGKTFQGTGFFVLYLVTAGLRQFLEPRLVGRHVGVSPLLALLSVYLGVMVYGGAGFLLGPLSALLLYGIFKEWGLTGK